MKFKVRKCGDELVVNLPDALAAQFGWGPGDILAAEVIDGRVTFVRTMTAHDHAMQIARDSMKKYRDVFETLAKT